ncbi:major facilitator superfamily domain-containing protein [Xylariales sp. PMI_506]|nr:major facilitator superfamily domain-containing protein [Xylariales sp. PMI_506]
MASSSDLAPAEATAVIAMPKNAHDPVKQQDIYPGELVGDHDRIVDEYQPLLGLVVQPELTGRGEDEDGEDNDDDDEGAASAWTPPRHFLLIELAIFSNVFLYGFDGTITAATYAIISSQFDAVNTASWLTTSYLVTSTAFQPLYGRISDLFGRRICFFISTVTFALGCLGCGLAQNYVLLNLMRALTGFGGGGLMTMATIVNSDMIPFNRRGMYQAMQNASFGFGAICGASFGGSIADTIGWRWCFLLQVPVSIIALVLGYLVIKNQRSAHRFRGASLREMWAVVDFSGALLLVAAISVQLVGLSLGGNELAWDSPWVIGCLVASTVLFGLFFRVEARTKAIPMIPLRMLRGRLPIATQISNVCVGLCSYAYLFTLPLFFQVVLQDSATTAGARLAIPSLATPIGGLIAGVVMSRWGKLIPLVRAGAFLLTLGNALVAALAFEDSAWKYFVYIFPANLGQGIVFPALLFTSLATFEHADHAVSASTVYLIRSLGTVWGVSLTSAIQQTTLSAQLPEALSEVPDKWRVIEAIRHSVEALRELPPEIQLPARLVYYRGLRYSFIASTCFGIIATITAFFANGKGLRNTSR